MSAPPDSPPRGSAVALPATLTLAMAVSMFTSFALGALGPSLTADLGLTRTALGSLTTVLFVVGGVLSPAVGRLVDRLGGRTLLLALFAVAAAAAAPSATATSYAPLAAAVALAGVAVALGNPATNQVVARCVPPDRQGVVVGVKQSGVQAGAFLAGAALPGLAQLVGWRGALLGLAALALLGVVATVATVPRQASAPPRPVGTAGAPAGALPAAVSRLAVYALLMGIGVGALGAYLPLYAVESLALSPSAGGFAAGLVGLVGVAARVLWGRGADRSTLPVPAALARLAAGAVVGLGLVWAAAAVGPWALWPGAVVLGATAVAWNAVGMLAVVRGVDAAVAGRASGRVLLGFFAGFVVSPVVFGWTVDRTGAYTLGWGLVTAAFAAAAVLAARWGAADRHERSAPWSAS